MTWPATTYVAPNISSGHTSHRVAEARFRELVADPATPSFEPGMVTLKSPSRVTEGPSRRLVSFAGVIPTFWVWTSQNYKCVFRLAEVGAVTVGLAPRQADLMKGTASFVADRVKDNSIFAVLHRECHVLFPDELFADLSAPRGALTYPLFSGEGLEVISLASGSPGLERERGQ